MPCVQSLYVKHHSVKTLKKCRLFRVIASDTAKESISAFYRITFERAVGQTDAVQPAEGLAYLVCCAWLSLAFM